VLKAQQNPLRSAASTGLVAQYQAALIRERRLADDRETRLISRYEVELKVARQAFDSSVGGAADVIAAAQEALTKTRASFSVLTDSIVRRANLARVEMESYRAELRAVVEQASAEKVAALERFGDGDRVGAWPLLEELAETSERARLVVTRVSLAPGRRQLALQREIMRDRGEASAQQVLAMWDKAAELDPTDFWTQVYRGRLLQTLGKFNLATRAFAAANHNAASDWDRTIALAEAGDAFAAADDRASALSSYESSLALAEGIAAKEPNSTAAQREVSVVQTNLGDILSVIGDLTRARAHFEASLVIDQRLATRDSGSANAQRDLSVSLDRLGDLHMLSPMDLGKAREQYGRSLLIRERLLLRDSASASAQGDVSISLIKLGDVLAIEGDSTSARLRYESSLKIRARLAARDTGSADAQREHVEALWKLAPFGGRVTWLTVVVQLERMAAAGQLSAADAAYEAIARRNANAQPPRVP